MDLEAIWTSDKTAAAALVCRNNLQIQPVLVNRKTRLWSLIQIRDELLLFCSTKAAVRTCNVTRSML